MSPRFDPRDFLRAFVDQHPGLRRGMMFGKPAGYAGTRVFAYVEGRTLAVRSGGGWELHRPTDALAARKLLPLLERSAREVAERHGSA